MLNYLKQDYKDQRFGIIDLIVDENEQLFMIKKKILANKEQFEIAKVEADQRKKIKSENLMKLEKIFCDEEKFVINLQIKYPSTDLYNIKPEIQKNPQMAQKLCLDILKALSDLQSHKMVHGDIKPEYIYLDD